MFRSFRNPNIWYQSLKFPLSCSAHVKMPEENFFWQLLILTFLMETEIRNHWVIEFLSFLSFKHQFWSSKSWENGGFSVRVETGSKWPGWRLKKTISSWKNDMSFCALWVYKTTCRFCWTPSCSSLKTTCRFLLEMKNDMSFPLNAIQPIWKENDMSFPINAIQPLDRKTTCHFRLWKSAHQDQNDLSFWMKKKKKGKSEN